MPINKQSNKLRLPYGPQTTFPVRKCQWFLFCFSASPLLRNAVFKAYNYKAYNSRYNYIDYEKAFDTVEHFAIFEALRKTNVNETYINILQNI